MPHNWLTRFIQRHRIAIVPGDTMRISVVMVDLLKEHPNETSMVAKVVDVRREDDGTKTLVLTNANT